MSNLDGSDGHSGGGAPSDLDLIGLIARLRARVLVIGDLMLDVYHYGEITRISPEAPVPVLRLRGQKRMLGGVGNVARNVASQSGHAVLVAPTGRDENSENLRQMLDAEEGVQPNLIACDSRPTSIKSRFVAAGQQVLRADLEEIDTLPIETEASVLAAFEYHIASCGAVVLSDYGKGALTLQVIQHAITRASELGIPVIVDPKGRDYSIYRGATCITPNLLELSQATDMPTGTDDEVVAAGLRLIEIAGAQSVLATRSERGMSLIRRDAPMLHLAARKREVFDVSGAGDTVVATLALALASDIAFPEAVRLANVAAGVVVTKQGTAICTLSELEDELHSELYTPDVKVRPRAEAERIAAQWRRMGYRVGFTNGCFDILHPGHVQILQQSRAACDRLIVGLNTDASVRRYKGPTRPVQDETARAIILSALACVDMVVLFEEDTPYELIRTLRPNVLLKGADYTLDEVVGADLVTADGGEVLLVTLVENQSTTSIIKRMA